MRKTFLPFAVGVALGFLPLAGRTDDAGRYSPPLPDYIPGDAVIQNLAVPPPSVITPAAAPASPTTTTNFLALTDEDSGVSPPDTQGAIGPSNIVVMHNNAVRIMNRSGTTNSTIGLNDWWDLGVDVTDPRIVYEPYNNRWIAAALGATTSDVLIGASSNSNPAGAWYRHKAHDSTVTNALNFTSLGFNKNWVVVTANVFTNSNTVIPMKTHENHRKSGLFDNSESYGTECGG